MSGKWLTPNTPPADRFFFRTLQIPATSEFLGAVTGALIELTKQSNWETAGTMTPAETAEYFLNMLIPFWNNQNEPPEWQNPDDLDGEPKQPWYEDLADWIIAGFLAVTFTPEAAIVYQATVPKLRVAIRTGNLGALFKVLINGIEVWSGDSYSPITDLIDRVFDMSAETAPYTVRIEHAGSGPNITGGRAKLEYVRQGVLADMVATILRADPSGCGIQWSTNNGGSWETIDLSSCITALANDAILQAIEDGIIQKAGGQPGPNNPPAPGICQTYHVILQGKERWLIPSQLNAGDVVSIAAASGGWSDGTVRWYCPDGSGYVLGTCAEGDKTHEGTDPVATEYHMVPIIGYGETPEYGGNLALGFIVPAGTVDAPGWIQANDGSLSDNYGQIEFDVTVCSGGWCYQFDWTGGDKHNWEVNNNPNDNYVEGYWTGYGWHTHGSPFWNLWVEFQALLSADVHITQMEMDIEIPSGTHAYAPLIAWQPSGGGAATFLTSQPEQNGPFDGTITVTHNVEWPGAGYLWLLGGTNSGGGFTLRRVRFYGNGACPFGTPNC